MAWKRRYKFKRGVRSQDMQFLSPDVLLIFSFLLKFAERRDLPVVITSLKHDRANIKTVSKTHETGRAIDISVGGWSDSDISECAEYIEIKASGLGAYSLSDGQQRPFIYHDAGFGSHIHLQSYQ